MNVSRVAVILVGLLTVGWAVPAGAEDFESIQRTIGKQPDLQQPLYALAVIGPKKDCRMWMIVDKSSPDLDAYDVLYIDLNCDGDLTDANERVTAEPDGQGNSRFTMPLLIDPKSGIEHTDFSLRISQGARPTHMLSIKWRGKYKLGGGYPVNPDDGYMRFGKSPQEAPIIWLNGDGPFRFQPWYNESLTIGGQTDMKFFLGQYGSGPSTFCAFQEHILPGGEFLVAKLIYTGQDGQQHEAASNLDRRC